MFYMVNLPHLDVSDVQCASFKCFRCAIFLIDSSPKLKVSVLWMFQMCNVQGPDLMWNLKVSVLKPLCMFKDCIIWNNAMCKIQIWFETSKLVCLHHSECSPNCQPWSPQNATTVESDSPSSSKTFKEVRSLTLTCVVVTCQFHHLHETQMRSKLSWRKKYRNYAVLQWQDVVQPQILRLPIGNGDVGLSKMGVSQGICCTVWECPQLTPVAPGNRRHVLGHIGVAVEQNGL